MVSSSIFPFPFSFLNFLSVFNEHLVHVPASHLTHTLRLITNTHTHIHTHTSSTLIPHTHIGQSVKFTDSLNSLVLNGHLSDRIAQGYCTGVPRIFLSNDSSGFEVQINTLDDPRVVGHIRDDRKMWFTTTSSSATASPKGIDESENQGTSSEKGASGGKRHKTRRSRNALRRRWPWRRTSTSFLSWDFQKTYICKTYTNRHLRENICVFAYVCVCVWRGRFLYNCEDGTFSLFVSSGACNEYVCMTPASTILTVTIVIFRNFSQQQ